MRWGVSVHHEPARRRAAKVGFLVLAGAIGVLRSALGLAAPETAPSATPSGSSAPSAAALATITSSSAPAPSPAATTDAPQKTESVSSSAPSSEQVVLLDAFYAEAETDLHKHLDKVVGASSPCQGGHPSCWTGKQPIASKCAAGHFCALGTAPSGTSIGLLMEGRLVAGPVTQAGECWLASVATADLPAGEVVRAVALDGATRVLAEGSAPRTSEFTTAVTFVDRSAGSPMGDLGAGFAIASTMHTARLRDVTKDPETNPLDPLTFGVRYEGALFSQDWLHRVTVTAGWELFGKHPVRVTPGIALGGYFSAQTSGGGGALSAGFLSGVSVHVDFQVQWQVACSVGYELQALVANGNTSPLQTFYIGPRVGF